MPVLRGHPKIALYIRSSSQKTTLPDSTLTVAPRSLPYAGTPPPHNNNKMPPLFSALVIHGKSKLNGSRV